MVVFGGDPVSARSSDFTVMDTGSHGGLAASWEHSHYSDSGTTSLHNQGQVLRGVQPDYVDDYSIGG